MKNIFTTVIFLLFLSNISFAQDTYSIREAMDFYRTNKLTSGDYSTTLAESDIEGSPYLNDEFVNGTVYTINKEKYVNIPLRYNMFNEQIEFKTPQDQVQALADPTLVDRVEFGENKMVYISHIVSKRAKKGYLSVLEEGKASLYAKNTVMFKKAEEPGAYKEAVPAQFIKRPDVYFIQVGAAAALRAGNKKEILEIFPDKQKEIAAYLKKHKVKTNNPDQLKELVRYYNSL